MTTATKTAKTRLTLPQAAVMAAIEAGNGHAHLPCCRGTTAKMAVKMATLESLSGRGLIEYRVSGGWAAVCRVGLVCREPNQHVLERDLANIVTALKSVAGWRMESVWELIRVVEHRTGTVIGFHTLCDAVRFGKRAGVLDHGTGFDYSVNQWDLYVELKAGAA